jgi:hypothetical protein
MFQVVEILALISQANQLREYADGFLIPGNVLVVFVGGFSEISGISVTVLFVVLFVVL